jgi:hypothetical protein
VKTENPLMEETAILFAFNDEVIKEDKVTLLIVMEDR